MLKPEASAFSGPKIAPSKPPALHVRWDPAGPSSSLRGTQIAFGGTRWDPVGPSPSLRGTLHPVWVLQC